MNPVVVQKCESIRSRRTLMEGLAQLLCQLQLAGEGMSAVQSIILPSQTFPLALQQNLVAEISQFHALPTEALQARLTTYGQNLAKACVVFFHIAKLDDQAFIQRFQGGAEQRKKFRALQHQLNLFQQQANECLALRLVLQGRGVQLERYRLTIGDKPLSQELLADEIQQLRTREHLHRQKLQQEIREMIADTKLLLGIAQGNSAVGQALRLNLGKLELALVLLEEHGVLAQLPELIENMEYDLLPEGFPSSTAGPDVSETPPPAVETDTPQLTDKPPVVTSGVEPPPVVLRESGQKANSLWRRLHIWLGTSWSVSWADTKFYKDS